MYEKFVKFYDKPFYADVCGHGEDAYLGSVEVEDFDSSFSVVYKIDLYLFKTKISTFYELCGRYGFEPSQHFSWGDCLDFFNRQYRLAPLSFMGLINESIKKLMRQKTDFIIKK
jgi:hypothetical protein